jgi:hypothetical protein
MVPPMTSIIKGGFFFLWSNPAPVKMRQGMSLSQQCHVELLLWINHGWDGL